MQTAQKTKGLKRKASSKHGTSKHRQQIVSALDKFFAGHPYTVEFAGRLDGKVGVNVKYTDFFSERLVGQMLSGALPGNVHLSLERGYSDKAVVQLLLQEYKRNKVAVVDCYEGELWPETIHDFVCRKLCSMEML